MRQRTLVPLLGAGVGRQVANLPLWREAASSLLGFTRDHIGDLNTNVKILKPFQQQIANGSLLDALSGLQALYGERAHWKHELYCGWLHEVFGSVEPSDVDPLLLQTLSGLDPRVILTTSYDTLIEDYCDLGQIPSATWLNTQASRTVLRGRGVLHLHGVYSIAESVILSRSDYQRVIDADSALRIANALFDYGTLLIIGCSPDGVDDPHIATLFETFAELADRTTPDDSPHIFLHAGTLSGGTRARLDRQGIYPYRYGDSFADLPAFLDRLAASGRHYDEDRFSEATRSILFALDEPGVLHAAAKVIREWVFRDVEVTVGYAMLTQDETLVESTLIAGEHPAVFSYPYSVQGWALIEGRILTWPQDSHRLCDVGRVRRLGRLEHLRDHEDHQEVPTDRPERLPAQPAAAGSEDMRVGELYEGITPAPNGNTMPRFIVVPVPRIPKENGGEDPMPKGVITIGTFDADRGFPTRKALSRLGSLSDLVYSRLLWLASGGKP